MFTVAVLIRSAYDGETIARLRNAIAKNRRMAFLRELGLYTRARPDFNVQIVRKDPQSIRLQPSAPANVGGNVCARWGAPDKGRRCDQVAGGFGLSRLGHAVRRAASAVPISTDMSGYRRLASISFSAEVARANTAEGK